MDTTACILVKQIGRLGYRVGLARDNVEAVNEETGERFIVRAATNVR